MTRYLDILCLVISHETGHDVTIYRDIRCDITHTRSPRDTRHTNPSSTKTHYLVAVYSCFFRLCLCPHLGCVRLAFLLFFCCPSAGHIIGLTVSPANSNLVPSGLGLIPERMHAFFVFIFFLLSFFPFPVFFPSWYLVLTPGTPNSSCEVPGTLYVIVFVVGQFMLSLWYFVVVERYGPHQSDGHTEGLVDMPSFNAFNDSVRRCCRTRRSCLTPSLFIHECCFQWFGLIAVVVMYWSCEGYFFGKTFCIRPGTWCWYCYGLFLLDGTAPSWSIHAPKSAGCACCWRFFSVPSSYIFCACHCQAPSHS